MRQLPSIHYSVSTKRGFFCLTYQDTYDFHCVSFLLTGRIAIIIAHNSVLTNSFLFFWPLPANC